MYTNGKEVVLKWHFHIYYQVKNKEKYQVKVPLSIGLIKTIQMQEIASNTDLHVLHVYIR